MQFDYASCMDLTLQQLRILDAVAREGSAGAAARRLRLTQPAISRAVASAEDHLGCALFLRQGRGMTPTPAGARAAETARKVVVAVERLRFDVEQLRHDRHGSLRVGTECYTCYHWLPSVLTRFRSEFPGFDVEIVPEATRDPLAAMADGRLDMAITHSTADPGLFRQRPLFRDELLAILPPGHPLCERERLEASDFADQTLLLHSDPPGSQVVKDFLTPAGVEPAKIICLQLTEAVLESVRAGIGITVMARWALGSELDSGRLIGRSLGGGFYRDWTLTSRADQAERPALAALARLVVSEPTLRRISMSS